MDDKVLNFIIKLSNDIRNEVLPHLGKGYARRSAGKAVGGDTTFSIDAFAEELLDEEVRKFNNIAYYSEDKGLVSYGDPKYILIVDPIDGTRPTLAGLECSCVSIALVEHMDNPKIGDVVYGYLQEIKNGTTYSAKSGKCLLIDGSKHDDNLEPSKNSDLSRMFWTIGFRGRPAEEMIKVLGGLVDISSVDGSVFDLGSASFAMLQVALGRLDAYVDVGNRILNDIPSTEKRFIEVGKSSILNNSPYDIAAAKIIAEEMGCIVTDGYGNSLDEKPLLGSSHQFQVSCIASANKKLHEKIVTEINKGIEKLK